MAGNMSDLERIKHQQNTVIDNTLESTRRIVRMLEESQSAGTKTIMMLENQGEDLNRVETGLDSINTDIKEAEKHLKGIEKWRGLFVMPWNRRVKDIEASKMDSSADKIEARVQHGTGSGEGGVSGEDYITRITDDAREDEMEYNMQVVNRLLGSLKTKAEVIQGEVDRQNKQLDKTEVQTLGAGERIRKANKRAENLLK
jgi:synaptosomal-associated protein 25